MDSIAAAGLRRRYSLVFSWSGEPSCRYFGAKRHWLAAQISGFLCCDVDLRGSHMAGRIGSVQKAQDGQSYGFVVYDGADRACVYLGFSTWHDADRAGEGGARPAGDLMPRLPRQ